MGKVFAARAAPIAILALVLAMGCGDKPKKPGCKGDKDCKNGLVCSSNKCDECRDDSQCSKGKKFVANAWLLKPQCEKDDQCPMGQVCQAGSCKPCASYAQCGPGWACEDGSCKRPKKCAKDDERMDDE